MYPKREKVLVCRPNPDDPGAYIGKHFGIEDTLDGGEVLPKFSVAVRAIFGK